MIFVDKKGRVKKETEKFGKSWKFVKQIENFGISQKGTFFKGRRAYTRGGETQNTEDIMSKLFSLKTVLKSKLTTY